jgi:hypothetical protein
MELNNKNRKNMIKRIRNTKIGDVFLARIDETHKRYLQYIISDLSQLNSDVIRTFKKKYTMDANPDLLEIVNDEIDFYAHCVTKAGIKEGIWEKVGNIPNIGTTDHILFKDKMDYTNPSITNDWWIWKINEEFIKVGKLKSEYKKAEFGLVFPPIDILYRLQTGKYSGFLSECQYG